MRRLCSSCCRFSSTCPSTSGGGRGSCWPLSRKRLPPRNRRRAHEGVGGLWRSGWWRRRGSSCWAWRSASTWAACGSGCAGRGGRGSRPPRGPPPGLVVRGGALALTLGGVGERLLGTSAPRIESIAVLPLENLSGDPEQEYFADGMTEALISDLAQISALRVISRTSVMQYKGARKPLPEIDRELNAGAVG